MNSILALPIWYFIFVQIATFTLGIRAGVSFHKDIISIEQNEIKRLSDSTGKDLCLHSQDIGENTYTWRECK